MHKFSLFYTSRNLQTVWDRVKSDETFSALFFGFPHFSTYKDRYRPGFFLQHFLYFLLVLSFKCKGIKGRPTDSFILFVRCFFANGSRQNAKIHASLDHPLAFASAGEWVFMCLVQLSEWTSLQSLRVPAQQPLSLQFYREVTLENISCPLKNICFVLSAIASLNWHYWL